MKPTLICCFCMSMALIGCVDQPGQESAELSMELRESITSKLEGIALDFLKSWEPPYDPEAALELFTQKEDFHVVIGGGYTCDNYMNWTEAVPSSMHHEEQFYDSYTHEVEYMNTVVLSPKAGVVTIVYMWDSVSKEGVHERTPGAFTITCRKENDGWKIVHYHGSHDDPEVIN